MSKYDDLFEYHTRRVKELNEEVRFWIDRARIAQAQDAANKAKLEIYEKIIAKLLGDKCSTDEVFIFEGNVYKPTGFNLRCTPGDLDTLEVDFIKVDVVNKKETI